MGDRRGLMSDYDVENQFELGDLVEDGDEDSDSGKRTSFDEEDRDRAGRSAGGSVRIKKETVRPHAKGSER